MDIVNEKSSVWTWGDGDVELVLEAMQEDYDVELHCVLRRWIDLTV